ncbi:MAG: glycosyltransferase family 2 protein [Heliobacteriaceae bacterium]|jgi:glycosyltransferase involved in cell wall biosynthesis|nr:glycosyltransferase family 2 protein [Heliobacteriaceae bacterium]
MPKISVIIPVYNVEAYLAGCLDSICRQSLKDIEIICVNDGSTDKSLAVLHDFARREPSIKIIDKENGGSGKARNTALQQASGEYVFFVDGDDWLEENALEKMSAAADKDNLDMLIFGGFSCKVKNNKLRKKHGGYSYKKIPKKYFNKVFSFIAEPVKTDIFRFPSTAWTKLYQRKFLLENNIRFQEMTVGEDQFPFFHSMISAERIAVLPQNLYCYRKNRIGSAMTVKRKKDFSPVYIFYAIEELLQNKGLLEEYGEVFINKYLSKASSWLGKFDTDTKHEYFELYTGLLAHIKKEYPSGWWVYFNPELSNSYGTLKLKIFLAKTFKFMLE